VVASDSFATIFEKAETAKNDKDYKTALFLLSIVKKFASENMTLKDNLPLIICRQALCTYKLKEPNEKESYEKANEILSELNPIDSRDPEVLGLSGAINKRLYELTNDSAYLEKAISFYEKGYELKKDYYNGINLAFMLYKKASDVKKTDPDWEDIKLKADFYRTTVLEITLKTEQAPDFNASKDAIWVLLTIAEAYNYKGREDKMLEYENKAKEKAEATKDTFAMSSYIEQKEKIRSIFEILKN
jgi:tetratricopeptide (TPR) repeat protein